MQKSDPLAEEIVRKYARASGDRGIWESHWEDIAERILPEYSGSFTSKTKTPGQKNTEQMVDSTAAVALMRFAAHMESMLTPRNSTWHHLVPSHQPLMKDHDTRVWFDNLNEMLFKYRYTPKANYASQQHMIYLSLGAFGTGCLHVDKLGGKGMKGLRYSNIPLGQIYFLENYQGVVDTALRKFELTARQAMQQFGEDSLPEDIVQAAKTPAQVEKKFWFIHCVTPRSDAEYDPERLDVKGMPFAAHYVAEDKKVIVQEGGYQTFPYAISRYVVGPGELYGRSPAMTALPSIKVLNEQKKTVLKQGHKAVDPVLLAHNDGILDSFSRRPGAINYGGVSPEGRALIQALPVGNLSLAQEMMDAERQVINDVFLLTLFQILIDTPQMTATEVLQRAAEKGALLSPTMGRQQSEAQGPMIEREIDLLMMQGLLPPMPPALLEAKGEFEIQYDSPLSRAQKAEGNAGTMRTIGWASEIANATGDMSPLDNFNFDVIIPELGESQAMPVRFMSTPEEVAAKRQARAQQQEAQMMAQSAPAISQAISSLPRE